MPATVGLIGTASGEQIAIKVGDGDTVLLSAQGAAEHIVQTREVLAARLGADHKDGNDAGSCRRVE